MKGHWCFLDAKPKCLSLTLCTYIILADTVNLTVSQRKELLLRNKLTLIIRPLRFTHVISSSFLEYGANLEYGALVEESSHRKSQNVPPSLSHLPWQGCSCAEHTGPWWASRASRALHVLCVQMQAEGAGSKWDNSKHKPELILNGRNQFNVKGLGTFVLGSGLWTSLSICISGWNTTFPERIS